MQKLNKRRVTVIGAGTLGMSVALQLAERGAEVTVIDMAGVASGSSGRSVGVVGTQHVDPFEVLIRTHSLRHIRNWTNDGLEFHSIGYLRLGRSSRDMELFQGSVDMQQSHGIATSSILSREDITKLVPHMSLDGIDGALFGPQDGFLDPYQMCTVILKKLKALGGVLLQGCKLLKAEQRRDRYHLVTTAGDITCDAVVNAAGAWAPRVAAAFGQTLHVVAERHQAATLHLTAPLPYTMPMVMDYVQGGTGTGLNVRHDRPGQLITEIHKASPGQGEDPDRYDEGLDEQAKLALAELLLERMPNLPEASFGRGWAGLYPKSHDGRPYVGPIDQSQPSLITAAGAGGYGIQLGPVIGQLAADWLAEGGPASIPEAICLCPTPERNRPTPIR